MDKCTVVYGDKKFKIPLIKCDDCIDRFGSCTECLKNSWREACINAGSAELLIGGCFTDEKDAS